MKITDSAKIAKKLRTLWITSIVIVGIVTSVYLINCRTNHMSSPFEVFSGYHISLMVILVLYFIPILIVLQRHAKLAGMKKTLIFTRLCLFHHVIWLLLSISEMIQVIGYPK